MCVLVLSPTVPDDACIHVLAIVLAVIPVNIIVLILTCMLVLVVDASLVNYCGLVLNLCGLEEFETRPARCRTYVPRRFCTTSYGRN